MRQLDLPIGGDPSEVGSPLSLPKDLRLEVMQTMAQMLLQLVHLRHEKEEDEGSDE